MQFFKIFLIAATLVTTLQAGPQPPTFPTVNGITVEWKGDSPNFDISMKNDTLHEQFFTEEGEWIAGKSHANDTTVSVNLSSLIEYDTDGKKVNENAIESFAQPQINGVWSSNPNGLLGNLTAYQVDYSGKPKNGFGGHPPLLNITTYVVMGNGTASLDDTDVQLYAGDFKISLFVADWPFASPQNTLTFTVQINSGSAKNKTYSGSGQSYIKSGDFYFLSIDNALVNGKVANTTGNVSLDGNTFEYQITFPAFNGTLVYDPVVTTQKPDIQSSSSSSGDNDHKWLWIGLAVGAGVALAVLVALVIVILNRRRSRRHAYEAI